MIWHSEIRDLIDCRQGSCCTIFSCHPSNGSLSLETKCNCAIISIKYKDHCEYASSALRVFKLCVLGVAVLQHILLRLAFLTALFLTLTLRGLCPFRPLILLPMARVPRSHRTSSTCSSKSELSSTFKEPGSSSASLLEQLPACDGQQPSGTCPSVGGQLVPKDSVSSKVCSSQPLLRIKQPSIDR